MLEKIKVLKTKGEILKALISLADDETEKKDHQRALKNIKNELLKMLESFEPKTPKQEQGTAKKLDEILADNQADLSAIDDDKSNPLF